MPDRDPRVVALERRCVAWMVVLCAALALAILQPDLFACLFPNP